MADIILFNTDNSKPVLQGHALTTSDAISAHEANAREQSALF